MVVTCGEWKWAIFQIAWSKTARSSVPDRHVACRYQDRANTRSASPAATGEGQLARLAVKGGAGVVVGVDPTWAQLTVARERAGGPVYARAGAAALPCRSGAFDAVVACLVFEHIEDYTPAIGEVARVL